MAARVSIAASMSEGLQAVCSPGNKPHVAVLPATLKGFQSSRAAMAFVARSFNAWAAANPVSAACFFGGGKNVGVDACVQLATAGGDVRQMDLRRSACFLAFGTLWIGGAQYYIFNKLIPRLVPAINAPNPTFATALKAGAWDWAVHMPLFCRGPASGEKETFSRAIDARRSARLLLRPRGGHEAGARRGRDPERHRVLAGEHPRRLGQARRPRPKDLRPGTAS